MTTSRDRYLTGNLGSYDTSTVARVDSHLRALHMRARLADLTDRQAGRIRDDIDLLLDARCELQCSSQPRFTVPLSPTVPGRR